MIDQFLAHAVAAFDKQLWLVDLVGDFDWQFDMASGLLSFGDRFCWRAQVLGTESESSSTWLWSWANDASNIPTNLLGAAKLLRIYGEHVEIPEFTEPKFVLREFDGHALAMIATGICRANAYYRAAYEGGAA